MSKKLYISLIFSNLVVSKTLSPNHRMYNLYTKFVKILEICKQFSENLVNELGNVPRRGPVPKFSDLEVVALSLTAETDAAEKRCAEYRPRRECGNPEWFCINNAEKGDREQNFPEVQMTETFNKEPYQKHSENNTEHTDSR